MTTTTSRTGSGDDVNDDDMHLNEVGNPFVAEWPAAEWSP
jgi:hypothetical protein